MKKVLIIRFSSIGDIVLTSPIVRCLAKNKKVEIHYLTKNNFKFLLESNPHIHKIHTIEEDINEIIPQLQAENFDTIIDLHKNLRTFLLKRKLQGKKVSFNKLNIQKWLHVNTGFKTYPKKNHIVDRYFEAVAPLGIKNDKKGLEYFIPKEKEIDLVDFFDPFYYTTMKKGYLVAVIGGQHETKKLPIDHWIKICKSISKPILILGGEEEALQGRIIAKESGMHVINTAGIIDFHQAASLVRQAALVITHDTGLMHVAASFSVPTISIWGNTVTEFGMTPYYPSKGKVYRFYSEVKELKCRPCSKIGFDKCPKGHFSCMMQQNIDLIIKKANKF